MARRQTMTRMICVLVASALLLTTVDAGARSASAARPAPRGVRVLHEGVEDGAIVARFLFSGDDPDRALQVSARVDPVTTSFSFEANGDVLDVSIDQAPASSVMTVHYDGLEALFDPKSPEASVANPGWRTLMDNLLSGDLGRRLALLRFAYPEAPGVAPALSARPAPDPESAPRGLRFDAPVDVPTPEISRLACIFALAAFVVAVAAVLAECGATAGLACLLAVMGWQAAKLTVIIDCLALLNP